MAILFSQIVLPCHAQEFIPADTKVLTIDPRSPNFEKGKYPLKDYLYVLTDSTGTLSHKEVSSSKYTDLFVPLAGVSYSELCWNRQIYWLRLSLETNSDRDALWLINLMEAEVEGFVPSPSGEIESFRSGVLLPVNERYLKGQYGQLGVLPVHLPAHGRQDYYWRIHAQPVFVETEQGVDLNRTLLQPAYLGKYLQTDGTIFGFAMGLVLAVGLYHLIIFLYSREFDFLRFFFFCLFSALLATVNLGYDLVYLWPDLSFLHYYWFRAIFLIPWIFTFIVFSRSFLQISQLAPFWDKALWTVFAVAFAGFIGGTPLMWVYPEVGSGIVRIGQLSIIVIAILLFVISIISLKNGSGRAKFYLIANTAYLFCLILEILNTIGKLPRIDHVNWVIVGSLIQLLLFAVGLGQYFRQKELQRLVADNEALRLQELDMAKTRLYNNITHEFRTPLTVIMGMMDTITGHEQARKLVLRNSRQLLQLVNQMLDLSKLESGLMQPHNQQADIVNFLRYLTESFYSMAQEREIQLSFLSDEPELIMDFDEEKLQHIVYNLLSNALKFTPPHSGGSIELCAQKIEQAGQNWLQLHVQDTGTGIAEANLPHIFDRFYQTDDSHTRAGEGTGIGLALTKEFVELMGGNIAVRSTPGKGSTFTILLPISNEAPFALTNKLEKVVIDEPESEETTSLAAARLNKRLSGEKPFLLIVEDNKDVVAYIRTLLEKDYQIQTAANGKTGLEMALELVPDIIISDVMMPEMDGYTLTQTLKTDERTSHIPIILLTAKAEEKDRLTGLRTGADAYLVKPFNKAELLVRLEKLTELRRQLQRRYSGFAVAPAESEVAGPEDAFLQKLIQLVEAQLDNPEFTAAQLYTAAHMSQPQLYRKLMALTGKSPALFIRAIRLRKAADMLRNTDMNVSEIAWATGFNDPSYFARVFHEEFGKAPGEWRR